MEDKALRTLLLDLDHALGGEVPLLIAGGYGLYLKQNAADTAKALTLFPKERLPIARTTEDVDLFLSASIVVDAGSMKRVRETLNSLGFTVLEGAKYFIFTRPVKPAGRVKIDLLVGPLGELYDPNKVNMDERRVRPKAYGELHARSVLEAVAVEDRPMALSIEGELSSGAHHTARIFIPQAFTYLLMKLHAFRDRVEDEDKNMGRHHALDIYRALGLVTLEEDSSVRELAAQNLSDAHVQEARRIVAKYFSTLESVGMLRMREHSLFRNEMDLTSFLKELAVLLPPLTDREPLRG